MAAATRTFQEKDFHFLKIGNGRILIMDQQKPENTQIYTYAKFLEIYDTHGLDGFLVH